MVALTDSAAMHLRNDSPAGSGDTHDRQSLSPSLSFARGKFPATLAVIHLPGVPIGESYLRQVDPGGRSHRGQVAGRRLQCALGFSVVLPPERIYESISVMPSKAGRIGSGARRFRKLRRSHQRLSLRRSARSSLSGEAFLTKSGVTSAPREFERGIAAIARFLEPVIGAA